jgi:uncharacterized caspase-like protein/WD40 repeat protein
MNRGRRVTIAAVALAAACRAPHVPVGKGTTPSAERKASACPGPAPRRAPTHARQVLQTGSTEQILTAAWSPSGYLATFSDEGAVRVWDMRGRGALLGTYQGNGLASLFTHLAWSANARLEIVAPDQEDAVAQERVVLDTGGRLVSRTLEPDLLPVVRTSAGDQFGTAKVTSKTVKLAVNGTTLSLTAGPDLLGPEILLSRDGSRALSHGFGWGDYEASFWDLTKPAAPPVVVHGCRNGAPSPNVDFVACYEKDAGSILVRPIPSGTPFELPLPDSLRWVHASIGVSPDGRLVAAAFPAGVVVFDVQKRKMLWTRSSVELRAGAILAAAQHAFVSFAPDGDRLAVASGGWLGLLDPRTGRSLAEIAASAQLPRSIAWAGQNRLITLEAGVLAVWATDSGTLERRLEARDAWINGFAVLPGGDLITTRGVECAAPDKSSTVRSWFDRWHGLVPPGSLEGIDLDPDRGCRESAASPTSWPPSGETTMLSGAGLNYDLVTGDAIFEVGSADGPPSERYASVIGTGKRGPSLPLEGGSIDWQVERGWAVHVTNPGDLDNISIDVYSMRDGHRALHLNGASSHRISDDGKWLITFWGKPDDIVVYEIASGKELARTPAPKGELVDAVELRDGTIWLGTSTWTNVGRYYRWSIGGAPELVVEDTTGALLTMALDPTGHRLAIAGVDGATRVVDLEHRRLAASFLLFDDGEWIAYTPNGAYGGTNEVTSRLDWVFDGPTEAYDFQRFAHEYGRPDILRKRLSGEDVDADPLLPRPPNVRLVSAPRTSATSSVHLVVHVASGTRVDEVRALVEGRQVASRAVCANEADVDLEVPLLPASNRVTVLAYDDRGVSSNPVVTDVDSTEASAKKPDLWIVSLGVDHYPNLPRRFQLGAADNDARGIADALRSAANGRFADVHATVLVDDAVTVDGALRVMSDLAQMKPEDLAFVFFAGHGIKPTEGEGMVLLTSKASSTASSVRANGIGWKAIADVLAKAKGRVVLLLDACHSGAVSEELLVPNDELATVLAEDGRAGVVVFAAAKGRQFSLESNAARGLQLDTGRRALVGADGAVAHGFFTGAVLQSLHDPAADLDGDGVLELSELIDAVTIRVTEATRGRQSPWVARREVLGDFGLFAVQR